MYRYIISLVYQCREFYCRNMSLFGDFLRQSSTMEQEEKSSSLVWEPTAPSTMRPMEILGVVVENMVSTEGTTTSTDTTASISGLSSTTVLMSTENSDGAIDLMHPFAETTPASMIMTTTAVGPKMEEGVLGYPSLQEWCLLVLAFTVGTIWVFMVLRGNAYILSYICNRYLCV